jgi:SAM-dependent methyltransferase
MAEAKGVARTRDVSDVYEEYQAWPPEVTEGVARYLLSALGTAQGRCLVLGCATGVNDVLPLARAAGPARRIVAGDVEPGFLERLQERILSEGLSTVEARVLDVTQDLSPLGSFDLVSLLFVIHRLKRWEEVVDRVSGLLAPGGFFFISEFAGPGGIIYLSNEAGGTGTDSVSRMIRRYFELLPERFTPELKSTNIAPVLDRLAGILEPQDHQDFSWHQTIMPGEMFRRIRDKAYAPYFGTRPAPGGLDQLRAEFAGEWTQAVRQTEVIRIHRFRRR